MPNRVRYALRIVDWTGRSTIGMHGLFTAPRGDEPELIYRIGHYLAEHLGVERMPELPGVMRHGTIDSPITALNRAARSVGREIIWLADDSDAYALLLVQLGYDPSQRRT